MAFLTWVQTCTLRSIGAHCTCKPNSWLTVVARFHNVKLQFGIKKKDLKEQGGQKKKAGIRSRGGSSTYWMPVSSCSPWKTIHCRTHFTACLHMTFIHNIQFLGLDLVPFFIMAVNHVSTRDFFYLYSLKFIPSLNSSVTHHAIFSWDRKRFDLIVDLGTYILFSSF